MKEEGQRSEAGGQAAGQETRAERGGAGGGGMRACVLLRKTQAPAANGGPTGVSFEQKMGPRRQR